MRFSTEIKGKQCFVHKPKDEAKVVHDYNGVGVMLSVADWSKHPCSLRRLAVEPGSIFKFPQTLNAGDRLRKQPERIQGPQFNDHKEIHSVKKTPLVHQLYTL